MPIKFIFTFLNTNSFRISYSDKTASLFQACIPSYASQRVQQAGWVARWTHLTKIRLAPFICNAVATKPRATNVGVPAPRCQSSKFVKDCYFKNRLLLSKSHWLTSIFKCGENSSTRSWARKTIARANSHSSFFALLHPGAGRNRHACCPSRGWLCLFQ